MVVRRNMSNEPTRVHLENEEGTGPQLDITFPQSIEVKFNGKTLWVNIDEVCRLRVSRVNQAIVKWDVPGFTQREVEG